MTRRVAYGPSVEIDMGGNKITNLADGVDPDDAATVGQITGGGSPTGSAGGVLDGTYPNPGLAAGVAGGGLAESSDVLSVNVDGTTIEITADALNVKSGVFDAAGAAAAAQAASQPLDSDLTAIGGLSPSNDDVIQRKAGAWTNRTMAQLAADLGSVDVAGVTHAATSKATPVDADELPLVDSAASNVLKKLLWSNLKATLKTYFDTLYAPVGGGSAPIGTPELIYRYTVTGSDKSSIDTGVDSPDAGSNDWTGGDLLEVWCNHRTDESVSLSVCDVILNNDTGANYERSNNQMTNSTNAGQTSTGESACRLGAVPGANASANVFGSLRLEIPNYAGTVGYKNIPYQESVVDSASAANSRRIVGDFGYQSTSAITRLKLVPETSGKKFKVGTQLLIYKRRSS